MLHNWLLWLASDWHWAGLILAVALLLLFGFVVVGEDSDGDWWIF